MITLHGFGEGFGLIDPSPFVLKVDVYLRMTGLEYSRVSNMGNMRKAPKGKLPFIVDGERTIADSSFIIEHLAKKPGGDLNAWLNAEQKAYSYLVTKSLDENLYFCLVYARWIRDDGWNQTKFELFSSLPIPIKWIVPALIRRGVKDTIKKQGLGRHGHDEVRHVLTRSLDSLSVMLGDKPYFMGDKPCELDAAAFGLLAELILSRSDTSFNTVARSYDNLQAYCLNIQKRFYGEDE
jgi:glutathione S-transferase